MANVTAKDDIIIRIPKKMYNKEVQNLLSYIEFKTIVSKSKATQKDIDSLMADIKKDRKKLMKPMLDQIKAKLK